MGRHRDRRLYALLKAMDGRTIRRPPRYPGWARLKHGGQRAGAAALSVGASCDRGAVSAPRRGDPLRRLLHRACGVIPRAVCPRRLVSMNVPRGGERLVEWAVVKRGRSAKARLFADYETGHWRTHRGRAGATQSWSA